MRVLTWLQVSHNIGLVLLWTLELGLAVLNASLLIAGDDGELFPYAYTLAYLAGLHAYEALGILLPRAPTRCGGRVARAFRAASSLVFWAWAAPRDPPGPGPILVQACDGVLGVLGALLRADEAVPPASSSGVRRIYFFLSALLVPAAALLGHVPSFWTQALWVFDPARRLALQGAVAGYALLSLVYGGMALRGCCGCGRGHGCGCKGGCAGGETAGEPQGGSRGDSQGAR